MLAVTRVNLDHFINDLMAGDPVVWGIVFGVIFFTGLHLYQHNRSIKALKENNTAA